MSLQWAGALSLEVGSISGNSSTGNEGTVCIHAKIAPAASAIVAALATVILSANDPMEMHVRLLENDAPIVLPCESSKEKAQWGRGMTTGTTGYQVTEQPREEANPRHGPTPGQSKCEGRANPRLGRVYV